MYYEICSKQHGINEVSIKQLAGHNIYYVFVNNSALHKSFNSITAAIAHIDTYLPVRNAKYGIEGMAA